MPILLNITSSGLYITHFTCSGITLGDTKYGGHKTADWGPMVLEAVERMEVQYRCCKSKYFISRIVLWYYPHMPRDLVSLITLYFETCFLDRDFL